MIVFWILLMVLLAVVVAPLLLPFSYEFRAAIRANPVFSGTIGVGSIVRLEVEYAEQVLRPKISVLGLTRTLRPRASASQPRSAIQQAQEQPQLQKSKTKGAAKRSSFRPALRSFLNRELPQVVLRFARDIITIVGPKSLRIHGGLGLSEPHLTSYAVAAAGAINLVGEGVDVGIQPAWDEEYCDLELELSGRIVLIVLLARAIRFGFSRPIRRIWLQKIRSSGKKLQPNLSKLGIK